MSNAIAVSGESRNRVTRRRDQALRRRTAKLESLADHYAQKDRPSFQLAGRLGLLVERTYETLRARESLLDDDGELCSSLDTYRRLSDSYLAALRAIGLTPSSVLPDGQGRSLNAVFERIGKVKKVRDKDAHGPATASAE